MSAGPYRALARRIWHGRTQVPEPLVQRAEQLVQETPQTPGRVHPLGRFEDEEGWQALRRCLPEPLAASLSRQFEWYGCRGAGFHTDAHYDTVLFGAWYLAGPARDVVLAGLQLPCEAGDVVVFDPFQPHAVLDPGHARYDRGHYAAAAASVFLAFEIELAAPVRERFGIGPAVPGAFSIGSATAVNAETGQIVR
ncbi:MAG TPA: hypothetical protein VH183_07520 [Burkholderiaceae bacterium]|jgi:hypothetical protein|nr:hypothetical protein [Burkholderiaceae bacterium]